MASFANLESVGRLGGVALVALGLLVVAWTLSLDDAFGWDWWSLAIPGPLLILYGGAAIRQGVRRARESEPRMTADSLRAIVRTRELGFGVCTRCHSIMEKDWAVECHECGSAAELLAVSDEEGRKIALTAITPS